MKSTLSDVHIAILGSLCLLFQGISLELRYVFCREHRVGTCILKSILILSAFYLFSLLTFKVIIDIGVMLALTFYYIICFLFVLFFSLPSFLPSFDFIKYFLEFSFNVAIGSLAVLHCVIFLVAVPVTAIYVLNFLFSLELIVYHVT